MKSDSDDDDQHYDASLVKSVRDYVINMKPGQKSSVPSDTSLFSAVKKNNYNWCYVSGDGLDHNFPIATRDFTIGETILCNWVVTKTDGKEHPPPGSFNVDEGLFVECPGVYTKVTTEPSGSSSSSSSPASVDVHRVFSQFPLTYAIAPLNFPEKDCNLSLDAHTVFEVTKTIFCGQPMIAFRSSAVEISGFEDFSGLSSQLPAVQVLSGLILECELGVWQLLKGKLVMKDATVCSKFSANTIDQHMLRLTNSSVYIQTVLHLHSGAEVYSLLEQVISVDKNGRAYIKGMEEKTKDLALETVDVVLGKSSGCDTFDQLLTQDCCFLAECFSVQSCKKPLGYTLACCDRVFALEEFSLLQKYVWFMRVQEHLSEVVKSCGMFRTAVNMKGLLLERQAEFILNERFFIPSRFQDPEKSFATFEYQFADPLPASFWTDVIAPVFSSKNKTRAKCTATPSPKKSDSSAKCTETPSPKKSDFQIEFDKILNGSSEDQRLPEVDPRHSAALLTLSASNSVLSSDDDLSALNVSTQKSLAVNKKETGSVSSDVLQTGGVEVSQGTQDDVESVVLFTKKRKYMTALEKAEEDVSIMMVRYNKLFNFINSDDFDDSDVDYANKMAMQLDKADQNIKAAEKKKSIAFEKHKVAQTRKAVAAQKKKNEVEVVEA